MISETELFDRVPQDQPIQSAWATVGHPGDPDVVQLGMDELDGVTLVKVTLKYGAPQGKPTADDGGFNGYKITAQLDARIWDVPARGTRVALLIPGGDIETPGNPAIVFVAKQSPTRRFGRKKTVLDFTGKDVVLYSDKSISFVVETADGHRHVMSLSGDGGAQVISDGSGLFVKDGEANLKTIDGDGNMMNALVLGQDETSLMCTVDSSKLAALRLSPDATELSGGFITINFSTGACIGDPTTAVPILLPGPVPAVRVYAQPA